MSLEFEAVAVAVADIMFLYLYTTKPVPSAFLLPSVYSYIVNFECVRCFQFPVRLSMFTMYHMFLPYSSVT